MTQAKAATLAQSLIILGYFPLVKLIEGEYVLFVNDENGVLINTLKTFQDNNQIIIRATSTQLM